MITASQMMTPRPVAVRSSDRVAEAVQVLQALEIRHLPVVNEQHEMTGSPISVDLEAELTEIVDLMIDNKIGAVPVTDGDGRLAGIVSYEDVLRNLKQLD